MQLAEKFFKELKEFMLRQDGEVLSLLIPHYENLLDFPDLLSTMLVDVEENGIEIEYVEDKKGGYTDGEIHVYIHDTNRNYVIELIPDDRMWGYCMCEPGGEGYHPIHKCYGTDCDWIAPSFSVSLVTSLGFGKYKGEQRDMWESKKKWDKYTKEYRTGELLKEAKNAVDYIDYYQKQLIICKKELEELEKIEQED